MARAQLRTLDLQNNSIVAISEQLGALVNLKSLNVSNNRLTALPGAIEALRSLQTVRCLCFVFTLVRKSRLLT